MFASQTKSTVAIGDVVVTIRKLSARSLDKASEARQATAAAVARGFGADMIQALKVTEPAPLAPVVLTLAEQIKARYTSYDRASTLRAGIASWTAPQPLEEGIADLDEESAQKLHEAILDLSLPALDPKVAEGKG
jgi:hypothetical protein